MRRQGKGLWEVEAALVEGAVMGRLCHWSLVRRLLLEQALAQVVHHNWLWGAPGRVYRRWWSVFQSCKGG